MSKDDTKLAGAVEDLIDVLWHRALDMTSDDFKREADYIMAQRNYRNACLRELNEFLTSARSDWVKEVVKKIDTMPHYVRSKFADHIEVTKEDYADMLIADEVTKLLKESV